MNRDDPVLLALLSKAGAGGDDAGGDDGDGDAGDDPLQPLQLGANELLDAIQSRDPKGVAEAVQVMIEAVLDGRSGK